ncbi:MAG: hypothetical protein A2418_03330 [Candidatus Brennerbacteria bacterium RIFOXYC1_FULL_41_11]|uniref:NlpC/P60 domain-containing protein n=1 Tax=Candidatus Brennerbacteria bacterium RIFOXYD1_FULL_41_16 TaxID=1797529 RepID=A0A1G1XL33_9BACT|nr:MAG: hypothetical protein A2391_01010 [Candidatus Brennerbacteria bacterium RIFOXYB1_FULL_41_13]OGY40108.1 MAG: hypothetical protein A2418_03330 [Candidatus Brennerbacteria bacterium RIFOXYC1_FULL_41_11]OGY40671.1 MAG: hypothetical protein A2570_00875 [Candidatus Brennerbacteria bacterium RIFOXYD1_FULL_41_16]
MVLSKSLQSLLDEQRARYGELFWYQLAGNKIILMIERLAEQARNILVEENVEKMEIVSFENIDSIGEFYLVEAEQVNLETRPSKQEFQSITDEDLKADFTDQINDVSQNQIVRIFQPEGYKDYCLVVLHSFGNQTPKQIGWIKNLNGLRKLIDPRINELLKPKTENLISFKQACQKYEGVKYQIGGGSFKNGFDCSSLVQRIFYETKGIWLPRKARWQQMVCEKVGLKDLKQGDLVFFNKIGKDNDGTDHVALVLELQSGKLPKIFHTKKILGRASFEDLNNVKWLFSEKNLDGQWEVDGFGRVKEI